MLPIGDDSHYFAVTFGYNVCQRNVSVARYGLAGAPAK
jgi:hypothetical protein